MYFHYLFSYTHSIFFVSMHRCKLIENVVMFGAAPRATAYRSEVKLVIISREMIPVCNNNMGYTIQ